MYRPRKLVATALLLLAIHSQQSLSLEVLDCIVVGQPGCLEDHVSEAISRAQSIPILRITRDLAIIKTTQAPDERNEIENLTTLERLEKYLYGHSLKLEVPEELVDGAKGVLAEETVANIPQGVVVPLAEEDKNQGRGFIKKVVLPFLLGLKFKATAVIPIAMALIALKTWKALTLGLLSLFLTASMVVFKMTKPKVLNYEVYYPPSAHHHHVDDHYHVRRSLGDEQDLPYRAHRK